MHFEGGIRDLVVPVDTTGPWRRRDPGLANQPAIPCLACHQMHCQGLPLVRPDLKPANPGPAQETFRPSLALFDRRELESVPVGRLPLPEMRVGERRLKISPDRRQALFYQCHAPLASMQVGSGDNRTAIRVHEGLSCLACHEQQARRLALLCQLPPSAVQLRARRGNDGYHVQAQSPHNIGHPERAATGATGVRQTCTGFWEGRDWLSNRMVATVHTEL